MTVVERKAQLWDNFINNVSTGIQRAREQGKHIGRPISQIDSQLLVRFANGNYETKQEISQKSGISLATLYRRLDKERRNTI